LLVRRNNRSLQKPKISQYLYETDTYSGHSNMAF